MKKRRLFLLLLLLPAAWCAVFLNLEAWELALLYLGAAVLSFGLEVVMLYLSRDGYTWLRFLPLALVAVPLVLAWWVAISGEFLAELGAALVLIVGLCGLCGWGAAWALAPDKGEKEGEHREA